MPGRRPPPRTSSSDKAPAARDPLVRDLAAIREAAADPRAPASRDVIAQALASRRSFAVAAAAKVVAEASLRELLDTLPPAFDRIAKGGADADPNCRAKTAIASALHQLEWNDPDFFLRNITFVQRDKVWGGSVDTAAEVRGACALGLAALHDDRAVGAITGLLVDPEWVARLHAARALGGCGRVEAEAALRFKALAGDPEPQVNTEVFLSLLTISPRTAFSFVASFLDEHDEEHGLQQALTAGEPVRGAHCTMCGADRSSSERADAAAIALGQSHHDQAFATLRDYSERSRELDPERRRVALLAIAMVRSPEALAHLVGLVESGAVDAALDALGALGMHRYDEELRRRVERAAELRGGARILKALREAFGG